MEDGSDPYEVEHLCYDSSRLTLPFDLQSVAADDPTSWPWELKLLIMIVLAEAGPISQEQLTMVTWTVLNRYNSDHPNLATRSGWSSRLASILLNPLQYHAAFGDPRDSNARGGVFQRELIDSGELAPEVICAAWDYWYGSSDPEMMGLLAQPIFEALHDYANGCVDPTNGADSFMHVTRGEGSAVASRLNNGQSFAGDPVRSGAKDLVIFTRYTTESQYVK